MFDSGFSFMGTVTKALELLDLFTRSRPVIGLSDLARLADLNKATCYRLASELSDYGLIEQVEQTKEYRLGPAALRLAALREVHVPTRDAAMPVLQALADATGETAHLSLLIGRDLKAIALAYSSAHATRVMMEDTEILPFHATSSGQAVLAFQPDSVREAVLAQPLRRLTPHTVTDPAELRLRLAAVMSQGFAESTGGLEADVHSLAVPLFDALGRCSGGLAVAAPKGRMDDALRIRIRTALASAGSEITSLWGGSLPPAIATLWRAAA